jgi:hypothetical protein
VVLGQLVLRGPSHLYGSRRHGAGCKQLLSHGRPGGGVLPDLLARQHLHQHGDDDQACNADHSEGDLAGPGGVQANDRCPCINWADSPDTRLPFETADGSALIVTLGDPSVTMSSFSFRYGHVDLSTINNPYSPVSHIDGSLRLPPQDSMTHESWSCRCSVHHCTITVALLIRTATRHHQSHAMADPSGHTLLTTPRDHPFGFTFM